MIRYALLFLFTSLLIAVMSPTASATEEPSYTVLVTDDAIQIRQYDPMIVAETIITDTMRRSGNSGFRTLADYVFGNNTAQQKIDMTAPVLRAPSVKIDMTAPVIRDTNPDGEWRMAFVMPSEWTMATLPKPNNPAVILREKPAETIASITFYGAGSPQAFAAHKTELETWLKTRAYLAVGPARFAGYSGPWVPNRLKRQEVLIPVQPQ